MIMHRYHYHRRHHIYDMQEISVVSDGDAIEMKNYTDNDSTSGDEEGDEVIIDFRRTECDLSDIAIRERQNRLSRLNRRCCCRLTCNIISWSLIPCGGHWLGYSNWCFGLSFIASIAACVLVLVGWFIGQPIMIAFGVLVAVIMILKMFYELLIPHSWLYNMYHKAVQKVRKIDVILTYPRKEYKIWLTNQILQSGLNEVEIVQKLGFTIDKWRTLRTPFDQ